MYYHTHSLIGLEDNISFNGRTKKQKQQFDSMVRRNTFNFAGEPRPKLLGCTFHSLCAKSFN